MLLTDFVIYVICIHPYHLSALFLKCILIAQQLLYKRGHTAMIVARKTENCSSYSIEKTYQTLDKGFFGYPNTSNFVKIKTIVYQCSEILLKH